MTDRASQCQSVNDAKKVLFAQKGRTLENISPTANALLQHAKRVAYQAGHCWGQCLVCIPELPSPSEWDGQGLSHMCGSLCGPLYLKHQKCPRS